MNKKIFPKRIAAAALLASLALACGCSGSSAEESSIFVEIEAPTPAPMATLAITPSPTPVTLISESNTPRPTRPPTPTPEPTPEPTPRPTERPREEESASGGGSGGSFKDTPYKNNYTKVSVSSGSGKAGNFSSATLNGGGTVTQSVFSNAEITLVNYWSTTWGSCISEMGRLAELQRAYQGTGVQFLGVCVDVYDTSGSTAGTAKAYIDSTNVDYPVLVQTSALTTGLAYLPSTHIYDSSGNMIAKYTGGLSSQDWINVIETLMN